MASKSQVHSQLEPWCDLENKVVLVTGASSGLGREFCLNLAKVGCKIVAAARRVDRLKSLCDEINQLPGKPATGRLAVAVELDVCADGPAIDKSVQIAWGAFGRIDALVNNAGVRGSVKTPLDLTVEEWDHVFNTNLKGSWLVSKYVCIRMRDAKLGGSIINISSIAGVNRGELPGAVAYASSKAGLNAMTKVMALELGVYKIRVNSISPGLFKSEITEGLLQKDWLTNVALKTVPLREYGTSDPALTSLVRYLIHDSSGYVSGNIFIVDAGATLPDTYDFEELSKTQRSVLDPPWEGLNHIPGGVLRSDPTMKPGLSRNKERDIGLLWGPDCTEIFFKKFQLQLIIRSHEGPDARETYTVDHIVESGKLIAVFSAPDYP